MKFSTVVIVAWICWIAMAEPPFCACLRSLTRESTITTGDDLPPYTVKYTSNYEKIAPYTKFMIDLNNRITYSSGKILDIQVLPCPRLPDDRRQYVYVELTNKIGDKTITLALNISSVDFVGYQAGETSYFFNTTSEQTRSPLFLNAKQYEMLPFSADYGSLEAAAGITRREISYGVYDLNIQIEKLRSASKNNTRVIAKALIVMSQMVCEAARSRYTQEIVIATINSVSRRNPYTYFVLDDTMLDYERNWEQLSSMVRSASFGVFPKKVKLGNRVVEYVRQIVFDLPLLTELSSNCASSPWLPMRSMLERTTSPFEGGAMDLVVNIVGYNGLCLDVDKDYYGEGNTIVLFDCGKAQANQLWTLSNKDQTIRSKGKCLATYGLSPNDFIEVSDCSNSNTDLIKWQVFSDGSIVNPKSGIHLTARDRKGIYTLYLDNGFSGSRQSWFATNVTQPFETSIVRGQDYQCLQLYMSSASVWASTCDIAYDPNDNKWMIYGDGTIRPKAFQDRCLKIVGEDKVRAEACDGGSSERWLFQAEGSILHMKTNKVIDTKQGDVGEYLGLNDYDSSSVSQIWFFSR